MESIQWIYTTYKQDVFQYLLSLTHDKTLSEDLTSDTFLSAIISLPKFEGRSDIKTWLFSIARYKWYHYLRQRCDTISIDDLAFEYLIVQESIEKTILDKEILSRFYALLEMESQKNKNIVLMRMEGYSFYEIGKKYSISENSARVIDFRIRKKFKTLLRKEGHEYE